jgi:hypothetical protein
LTTLLDRHNTSWVMVDGFVCVQAQQGMQQAVQRADPTAQAMMMQRAMQQQAAALAAPGMPGASGAQPPAGPPQEADMSVEDMSDVTAVAGIDMVTEQNALLAGACLVCHTKPLCHHLPTCTERTPSAPRAAKQSLVFMFKGRSLCQTDVTIPWHTTLLQLPGLSDTVATPLH